MFFINVDAHSIFCFIAAHISHDTHTPHSINVEDVEVVCVICRLKFKKQVLLDCHMLYHTQSVEEYADGDNHIGRCEVTALSGMVRDYRLWCDERVTNIRPWMNAQCELIRTCFLPLMNVFMMRSMFYLRVKLMRVDPVTGVVVESRVICCPSLATEVIVHFEEWFARNVKRAVDNLEKFTSVEGSDWLIECVEDVLFKVSLMDSKSGRGVFELPEKLRKMRAVVNVDCEHSCFKYAVLSVLHYNDVKKHRQRVSKYEQWEEELNFGDLDVECMNVANDVPKFEKLNNIKVVVHVWERGLRGIRYTNRKNTSPRTVNLLLVVNKHGQQHYCGIPQISRLYHHTIQNHTYKHICERCIQTFHSEDAYNTHYEWCIRGRAQIEEMPTQTEYKYTQLGCELSPLRVVYADAECYVEPDENRHMPAAIGMYEVWHENHVSKNAYESFDGEECVVQFLKKLDEMAVEQFNLSNLTRQNMIITPRQQYQFNRSTVCPKCNTTFSKDNYKVRDHDHITGQYRSPLCRKCNTQLILKRNILPVVFHNFKNYDAHLLIKHGIDKFKHWQLSCIPQTTEKFMYLEAKVPVGKTKTNKTIYFTIRFIDSYQFMSSSLATLANNLHTLPHANNLLTKYTSLSSDIVRRKGIFPYSYFSSLQILAETSLPTR